MKDNRINAIIIGIGNMGRVAAQCMITHDINIVAAVDIDETLIGRDVGVVSGIMPIGIQIQSNLEDAIKNTIPDIAIVSTETALAEIEPTLRCCIENKINVVTTSEESYYPWKTAGELAKELDLLAKHNNVTVFATGIQDVFYSNISDILSGACKTINMIKCYNFLPLDDMGQVVANEMFLGEDKEKYEKFFEESGGINPLAEDTLTTVYAVAESLELDVTDTHMECLPILTDVPIYYRGMDTTIPAGKLIGISSVAGAKTAEGIEIEIDFCYKLTEKGETPLIEWNILGEPNLRLIVDDIKGENTTSYTLVNRIPDVLNSEPGFKTFLDMPKPKYRSKPMQHYVKEYY